MTEKPEILQQLRQVGEAYQSLLDAVENTIIHNHVECMSCVAFLTAEAAKSSKALAAFPAIVQAVEAMCQPVSGEGDDVARIKSECHLRNYLKDSLTLYFFSRDFANEGIECASLAEHILKEIAPWLQHPNRETSTPAMTAGAEGRGDCRAAFEADCRTNDVHIGRHHKYSEQYQLYETQLRWMGWQAAWNVRTSPQPKAGQAVDGENIVQIVRGELYSEYGLSDGGLEMAEQIVEAIRPYLSTLSPPAAQEAVPDAEVVDAMLKSARLSLLDDSARRDMRAILDNLRQQFDVSIGRKP